MADDWNERVWTLVASIPPGKVLSYGTVAAMLGFPRRSRHVSVALNAAPSGLDLPWHRVINSQGKISFSKLDGPFHMQKTLLEADGVIFKPNGAVDLKKYTWRPGSD